MATEPTSKRKLSAILMADAVGYSRLMGQDETATVAAIKASREIFRAQTESRSGRIVNAPGDSILAEFGSVVDALAAAVEIQREVAERNQALPAEGGGPLGSACHKMREIDAFTPRRTSIGRRFEMR